MPNDDICKIWQTQGPAPAPPPLEELRKKAGKFRSRIARRNFREYLVSALLLPYFGYCAWTARFPMMTRAGNGLMMAGLVYMMYQLHKRASASAAPGDMGWKTCVAFHRAELERQRDALGGVWKWYLGPLVPGLATIAAAGCVAAFRRSTLAGMLTLLLSGAIALGMVWLGRLNQKAAVKIQKQIDALDALATAA
jgi:hypothetical protein